MLVDSVRLRVRGGRGGRGAATFRAQPFEPRGGPDGGDGGRGGAVVLQASGSLETLQPFVRQPLLTAAAGLPGGGGRKEGRKGEDLVLEVPVGTAVFDDETEEQLADLLVAGETAVVAEGGPGGEGNLHRASSVNRSPSSAGPGLPGEERTLRLELKLPVDAALLGLPNAGKSELLAALTSARPRVGAYPHTTQSPELGVAYGPGGEPLRLVEIPPGDKYVRHLDRARVVVYVLDATEPDPAADLARLREIVQARRPAGGPPEVIVLNKVDEPAAAPSRLGYPVSAMTGAGLEEFVAALAEAVRSAPRPEPFQRAPRTRLKPVREATLQVWRRDWGFEVSGPAVERLLERTDLDRPDGFDRFQAGLDRLGVSRALEEAGVAPGDTVRIGTTEFEYQPG